MADQSPFSPTMQAQLEQLLQTQVDRSNRTTPVHQAAMAMAQHMAPGYAQAAATGGGSPLPTGMPSTPSVSDPGGPGLGTTAAAALFAELLKNPTFLNALKKLAGPSPAIPPAVPPGAPGAPATTARPTDVPPVAGSPSHAGMNSGIPGYFKNPDGSLVAIPGDPANSGFYGGGFGQSTDPRLD